MNRFLRLTLAIVALGALAAPAFAEGRCGSYSHLTASTTPAAPITTAQAPQAPAPNTERR